MASRRSKKGGLTPFLRSTRKGLGRLTAHYSEAQSEKWPFMPDGCARLNVIWPFAAQRFGKTTDFGGVGLGGSAIGHGLAARRARADSASFPKGRVKSACAVPQPHRIRFGLPVAVTGRVVVTTNQPKNRRARRHADEFETRSRRANAARS